MMPVPPFVIRWIVLAVLGMATFAAGYIHGLRAEADRHAGQMAEIAQAGATQTANSRAETARRQQTTQEIAHDYQSAQARLAARPVPALSPDHSLRLAAANHSSSGVSADAGARSEADGNAAERSFGPAGGPAFESEDFIRSCAADAQQVMWLQEWIERVVSQDNRSTIGDNR